MDNALQFCRICLSANVKMYTLKHTNMENLFSLLTQIYVDIADAKPTKVCFLCYARLRQCKRLQQQAIKSNDLLEQLLRGGIVHATANEILNNQYSSQDLQVSSTYYLDLEPANCKDVSLDPKVEPDNMLSVKREVEGAKDEEHNVTENLFLIYQEKEVKESHIEDAQKKCEDSTKTPVINTIIDRFQCNECGKQFSTKDILTDHIIKCMKTEITGIGTYTYQKLFSCNICEYSSTHMGHLKTHIMKHTGEKPFSCNICDFRCARRGYLKTHMMNHTGERPYSCNICDYRCAQRDNLKTHMMNHTGEKPFSCNICEYRCTRNAQLKLHMRNHTGEKPFSCNFCEYKSALKSKLKKHMINHTDEKPFSCSICKYSCLRMRDLEAHLIYHTGEKPFSCTICEYRCVRKAELKIHMMGHTGKTPFACKICEYRCARTCDLKRHMLKHTDKKPFPCNICEYRCGCKSNLKRHMRTHTK